MAFDKDTQSSIKDTARKLIAKHKRKITKHSMRHADLTCAEEIGELAARHALVTVNEKLSDITKPWGLAYWGEVKKQIKSKL